jgi:5'-3' exonuclease
MKPQEELKYLKGFIQLSKEQATKRDLLEEFIDSKDKVLLLDADSLLYNVVHFHRDKDTREDLEHQYEDFHSQVREIALRIEADGFEVGKIIYFFTTCKNNFRYKIYPEYKANRKDQDPELRHLVSLFKHYTIQMLESENSRVFYSDEYEADDLICEFARDFKNNSIVCSIDKDLRQIPTGHFDYYRVKTGEQDENGYDVKDYKGWSYTTPQEGYDMLLKQLLIGDIADNIEGVKGIGKVKAEKIVQGTNFEKLLKVAREYKDMERLRMNINLMKL